MDMMCERDLSFPVTLLLVPSRPLNNHTRIELFLAQHCSEGWAMQADPALDYRLIANLGSPPITRCFSQEQLTSS